MWSDRLLLVYSMWKGERSKKNHPFISRSIFKRTIISP